MKTSEKKKPGCLVRLLLVLLTLVVVVCSVLIFIGIMEGDATPSGDTQHTASTDSTTHKIVDSDDFAAYYMGARDQSDVGVFYVVLKIENKRESSVMVNLEDASVDNETIPLIGTGVPLVIAPGNSGQTGFIFSMVNLSISSMDEADTATFRIVLRDNETLDVVSKSELITVDLP